MTGSTCRRCGTEPRAGARFCDACGSSLDVTTLEAEHKQVTVLFADVVRSMDLANRLGAERLRELMSELFNLCGSVIQRYGGMVDKFTGDGIMALFGAPIALEDHAIRACVAALEIQQEATTLAQKVLRRDGAPLALRVGLNSGDVVVGQIGSSPTSYTAVGVQVGMAQRMESIAPPGGVMVSDATARLVEDMAVLGPVDRYAIKGSDERVPARLLRAITRAGAVAGRREAAFVGRDREMTMIASLLDDAAATGGAMAISGPAGIGKSRVCRELLKAARHREMASFITVCESHSREIPFRAVARLAQDFLGITDLESGTARAELRARFPSAEPADLVLLDELIGIRDPEADVPAVSAETRRRRVSALLDTAAAAYSAPIVFVVEDVHWIDAASESTLASLFDELTTPIVVVLTYRPEYDGALSRLPGVHRIPLGPLSGGAASAIAAELMGSDPSVGALTERIIDSAAGNPFYVQEIVRDFSARGVIVGERGAFRRQREVGDLSVPPTLQATIGARIDRLSMPAKRILNAAAVIGRRFGPELLAVVLGEDDGPPVEAVAELVHCELIDQVMFMPRVEYAFRHPLVQTVAHDAQIKQSRDQMHRRLAAAIEQRDPEAAEENAASIAAHLEAAGDDHAAVGWLLRAGTWFTNRDIHAARTSWRRARQLAERLPAENPDRGWMRAVPGAMLCGSSWRAGGGLPDVEFADLREVCSEGNLRVPLALGTAGMLSGLAVHGRVDEACRMSAEYVDLVEAIEEPALTVGLLYPVIHAKYEAGDLGDVMALAQRVVDLADGDPLKGNFLTGSPLAFASSMCAVAKCGLYQHGWRAEFDHGVEVARIDPTTYVSAVMFKNVIGVAFGALLTDADLLDTSAEVLHIAQQCSENFALHAAQLTRGITVLGSSDGDRSSAVDLLHEARAAAVGERFMLTVVPVIDAFLAAELARDGDLDGAVELARSAIALQLHTGGRLHLGTATSTLVDALLARRARHDIDDAEAAVRTLADDSCSGRVRHDLVLLALRAQLARATGDGQTFARLVDRYLSAATAAEFDGHMARARAMAMV